MRCVIAIIVGNRLLSMMDTNIYGYALLTWDRTSHNCKIKENKILLSYYRKTCARTYTHTDTLYIVQHKREQIHRYRSIKLKNKNYSANGYRESNKTNNNTGTEGIRARNVQDHI